MTRPILDTVVLGEDIYWPEKLLRRSSVQPFIGTPPRGSVASSACWGGHVQHYRMDTSGVLRLTWVVTVPRQSGPPAPWEGRQAEVLPEDILYAVHANDFYLDDRGNDLLVAYGYRMNPAPPARLNPGMTFTAYKAGDDEPPYVLTVGDAGQLTAAPSPDKTWKQIWAENQDRMIAAMIAGE